VSEKKETDRFYKLAAKYAEFYKGKVEVVPKVPIRELLDFAIWYTPGVAEPSRIIAKDPELSFEMSGRWNTIAVVSDGTRVLGLGNIGPEGAYPVMEGKALIFRYLGGVDAVPLTVRARDPEKMLELLELIEPAFGGINLEDIESPKCFYVLEEARKRLQIPVWHDDQQGTATVTMAGLLGALDVVGKKLSEVKIVLFGAGAANIAFYRLLKISEADLKKVSVLDSKGVLHPGRPDIEKLKETNPWKYNIAMETEGGGVVGGPEEAFKGADVVIAASKPGPGTIKKEWIASMADNAIVFAEANPVPEIWPWEAKEAGAKIVATGRSDFPNQVNNSLAFPAIFRGVLDVRARTVTDDMAYAAAEEMYRFAKEKGLSEDYIIPRMDEWEVFPRVAVATALKAIEMGVARRKASRDELYQHATEIIKRSQDMTKKLMELGFIKPLPE